MKLKSLLAATALGTLAFAAHAESEKNISILATGGTIAGSAETQTQAGYTSGQVGVETLLAAVPQLEDLANVTGEQVSLSLIHISEPTRRRDSSRMPSSD